jgi:uncharacterized protein (DUF433 family)
VRGTRVTLDTIVTASHAGATAEEIAQKFPTATPAGVYQISTHYLNQPLTLTCLSAKPPPQP